MEEIYSALISDYDVMFATTCGEGWKVGLRNGAVRIFKDKNRYHEYLRLAKMKGRYGQPKEEISELTNNLDTLVRMLA